MDEAYRNTLENVEAYFADVFPGAFINIEDIPMPAAQLINLTQAGFGAAEVVLPSGDEVIATFVIDEETIAAKAISSIYDAEQEGLLAPGIHDKAMDDIARGTFHSRWADFISHKQ